MISRRASFLKAEPLTKAGNFWFVAIGSGWVSYLTPDAKLVPVFNCNPKGEIGPGMRAAGHALA
jgi:gluconolactonase